MIVLRVLIRLVILNLTIIILKYYILHEIFMAEYYKLMYVRKDGRELGIPEEFILEINGTKSNVLAYRSEKPNVILVISGIEKLTEEEAENFTNEINS